MLVVLAIGGCRASETDEVDIAPPRRAVVSQLLERLERAAVEDVYLGSAFKGICQEVLKVDPHGDEVLPIVRSMLCSNEWLRVRIASDVLEYYGETAIPTVMTLIDRTDIVALVGTSDLIYPGATTFYGHGDIVEYDIDCIGTRAGWVLERITFQDFGFRSEVIHEELLLKWRSFGAHDVPMSRVVPRISQQDRADLSAPVMAARRWWSQSRNEWTRFSGVTNALRSDNAQRQIAVLQWLRNGDIPSRGLTPTSYENEILPLLGALGENKDAEVRRQVLLLLADDEQWWWKWKQIDPEKL
jgi:hypothetical protein